MTLPELNEQGELPPGVHQATLYEVTTRFGKEAGQRLKVTDRLKRIYQIARATGKLERLIIFGSYVTVKPEPNDVDIVLIFSDDFDVSTCSEETRLLLDHGRAADVFGASIFWIRPSLLLSETLEEFIAGWQVKRDQTRRGIVEIRG